MQDCHIEGQAGTLRLSFAKDRQPERTSMLASAAAVDAMQVHAGLDSAVYLSPALHHTTCAVGRLEGVSCQACMVHSACSFVASRSQAAQCCIA